MLGNKDPAYVNAELIAKDPNYRRCEACDKAETKTSGATWMRNSVQKKHMLFNNLPLSEQKPAEIKLAAAKNTLLESPQSTTKIGSGAAEL